MDRPHFIDPFQGRPGIFAFTSSHLAKQVIFRREQDFVFGVDTLAIGVSLFKIRVFCYCLMSNHLHLLLGGPYTGCLAFYDWVIHRLAMMMKERDGISGALKAEALDIAAVLDDVQFRNEVFYIIRNPYKARLDAPLSYRWSSGDVYFNPLRDALQGERLGDMTQRRIRTLFRTRVPLPPDYEHRNGRILNRCFVDYSTVERKVGIPVAFFDGIRRYDLESIVEQSHGLAERIVFTDEELSAKILSLCRNEYHVTDHHQLDRKTLLVLARTLARRFGAAKSQIARLLGIAPDILDALL